MSSSENDNSIILDIDGTLIDSIPPHVVGLLSLPPPDLISPWGDFIYKRPNLDAFIRYCFKRYKNVALWTAAKQEWADLILNEILKPVAEKALKKIEKRKLRKGNSNDNVLQNSHSSQNSSADSLENEDLSALASAPGISIDSPIPASSPRSDGGESSPPQAPLSGRVETQVAPFAFMFARQHCKAITLKEGTDFQFNSYMSKPLSKVFKSKQLRRMGFTKQKTLILEDTPQNCRCNYGNALYISSFKVLNKSAFFDHLLLKVQFFLEELRGVSDVRPISKLGWESSLVRSNSLSQSPQNNITTSVESTSLKMGLTGTQRTTKSGRRRVSQSVSQKDLPEKGIYSSNPLALFASKSSHQNVVTFSKAKSSSLPLIVVNNASLNSQD